MEENGGGGSDGPPLVHKAPSLLSSSVLDWRTWLPGLPPPPPPPPPSPPSSPLKSLCCVHSCTVHITSTAPFYSPTVTPPPGPAIAEQPPPRGNSFFHFMRARPDTQAHRLVGTWVFPPLLSLFLISFNSFSFSPP